ncbi:LysR family transcriptional regulator [Shouchella clausii]|uniref:LysR family transcriptional regulator n=1 Tax=Shouchella clausii TaxID=79880 RepID=UPI000BA5F87C|nr:LysR family transcriptional regulator [Shouchella clausii]MBU8598878.1 LysR family transcriptional regulator [Shouchella clausii]MCY1105721.1 LysR family transcriptional regulator [Shouchella clausii]PAD07134.1 LysR family transcriptional regulator [Shouchella clausii]PAE78349.1 LysR family transcriptional regulator [Shouchella clausii]PAF03174.1 LysR family transcriptional regulator [Shouchella clausii]
MDLRSIKTFQTIIKHGSFQKAAEELSYAQSTITMQMKKLESELGVVLIERGKPFQLTEAGRLLALQGDLLLQEFERLQERMDALVKGEAGHIRVGAMEPAASYRLPYALAPFYEKFPRVNVSVQIESSRKLIEMVEADELDLAICTAANVPTTVRFLPLFPEEVAILMPDAHPLANEKDISLPQLENEPMLITTAACPFRRNIEKQMRDRGLRPTYRMEISNMLALKHYVQAGYGIAAVPIRCVMPPPKGTVLKAIRLFEEDLLVGLAENKTKPFGRVATSLKNILQKNLRYEKEPIQK